VVAVARHDLDKVRSPGRGQFPFLVRIRDRHRRLADLQARAVVDASGTWTQPNPLGSSGPPALGEADASAQIAYGLPDILGRDRGRYAGRRTAVVGAGHSAATSLLALAALQQQAPGTQVVWAVRSATPRPLVGKGSAEADELPARGRLATDLAALAGDPAGAARRDPGPPAAALCASNRDLLARTGRRPVGSVAGWSAEAAAAGSDPAARGTQSGPSLPWIG
jgi:hypothetical protein